MKHLVAAIMFFQICGNDLVIIKNNQPYAVCGTVTQLCKSLDIVDLMLIRQSSSCSRLKEFKVIE
jgi:hypothetical protein